MNWIPSEYRIGLYQWASSQFRICHSEVTGKYVVQKKFGWLIFTEWDNCAMYFDTLSEARESMHYHIDGMVTKKTLRPI